MLTHEEREFYDVWLNEDYRHHVGYAALASRDRGIEYNHYARMYPFYQETWKAMGMDWPDGFPPMPENPEPPCPWPTREAMEARLDELEIGPHSHLTYREMREYMLHHSRSRPTAVMNESNTSGRLEPEADQAAISHFRASQPAQ